LFLWLLLLCTSSKLREIRDTLVLKLVRTLKLKSASINRVSQLSLPRGVLENLVVVDEYQRIYYWDKK